MTKTSALEVFNYDTADATSAAWLDRMATLQAELTRHGIDPQRAADILIDANRWGWWIGLRTAREHPNP